MLFTIRMAYKMIVLNAHSGMPNSGALLADAHRSVYFFLPRCCFVARKRRTLPHDRNPLQICLVYPILAISMQLYYVNVLKITAKHLLEVEEPEKKSTAKTAY